MLALQEYRKKKGYTQKQIAEIIGVVPSCVTQWESGVRKPDIVMLKKLTEVLGCSADDLLKTITTERNEEV